MVNRGENDTIEFKRKVRHPEKIVREMVAFANTEGGSLFIGVDDNLTIPGLKYPEEAHFQLQKALESLCRPAIKIEYEIIQTPFSTGVVHYYVPPSANKPHFAFLEARHKFGKAYVRIGERTVQASKEYRLILKKQQKPATEPITYGDHEKILLNYLGDHEKITLDQFSEISKLPKKVASSTLINLAANNIIRIIPREQEDWFVASE